MIKKIFSLLVLATSLVACTGDYTDWADPQHNDEASAITVNNGAFSEVGLIDFATIPADQEYVKVCDIKASASEKSPEYNNFNFEILLGEEMVRFPITANGEMKTEDLKQFIEQTYGKAPVQRDIKARVEQWVSNGETSVVTTGSSLLYVYAKLNAPKISENYYIVGGSLDWAESAANKSQKFSHSSQSVYDDPVFTITIPAAEGDTWFAIGDDEALEAIGNGDWSKLLGTTGASEDLSGMLKPRYELDGDHSLCVPAGSKYIKVEINMMDGTYLITPMNFGSYFYEIGGESGWSVSHALYGPACDGKYQGYYYLDSEFKFKPNANNWDGDYEFDGEGHIADNGGSNCPAPAAAFYQIDVDLAAGTYALTAVNSITVVGNHNGWNQADAACHMTYNTNEGCWEATLNLTADGFKFAMNDDWAVSWGGANGDPSAYGDLTQNGGKDLNLPAAGAGTYNIKLYLSYEGANKVVLTKQ